jgi:hypothetical protein
MTTSLPKYGVSLLFMLLVATTACGRTDAVPTAPTPTLATSSVQSAFGVEPLSVMPEFLHDGSCVGSRRFGARLGLSVRGGRDVILRGLRFSFVDRFGARSLPEVIPIPSLSAPLPQALTIPTASPVPIPGVAPLPGTSPIPIPGSSPVIGLVFPAGTSRVLPFFVRFGCGVVPEGFVFIAAEAADDAGNFSTSELRVRVGA